MTIPIFGAGDNVYAEDLNNLGDAIIESANAITNPATTAASDTTTSATYVNMAGTGSVTSFNFPKLLSTTKLLVWMGVGWQNGGAALSDLSVGVLVNGTDYECGRQSLNATITIGYVAGWAVITGLPAAVYSIQGRWKRRGGTGTPSRSNAEVLSMFAMESN